MKKQGMMSGSKQAIENGITTTTEKLLGGGTMTNPSIRLSEKEQEYVLSQLIQRNYDKRRGIACFNSRTLRSKINGMEYKKVVPPLGIYEHKFNTKHSKKVENKAEEIQAPDH
jgi:hypothetical protein